MNPIELNERLLRLRKGERVKCSHCGKGMMIPIGDYKTSKCFRCDKCGVKLNIN